MVGRGGGNYFSRANEADESEQLQTLADAGISAEDVDLVVQQRLRNVHTGARDSVETLRAAKKVLYSDADVGTNVPEKDRWGKGAKVTDTDQRGAWRVIAAAIASADATAESEDTPEQIAQKRREVIGGMVRREAEGRHDENLRLIESARPRRRGGRTGTWL